MNPESGSPADWLVIARSNLNLAKVERPEGVCIEELCNGAHQCVEKSLKAVILSFGVEPPWVHDIEALAGKVAEFTEFPAELAAAFSLTDYATTLRYPGPDRDATEQDLAEAIELAEAVFAWASTVIKDQT
ncbi:MAG: HEPN domain-containing protein [bacterium]|jgi:HEPN domain-containing protein